jgi:hypothetical protein
VALEMTGEALAVRGAELALGPCREQVRDVLADPRGARAARGAEAAAQARGGRGRRGRGQRGDRVARRAEQQGLGIERPRVLRGRHGAAEAGERLGRRALGPRGLQHRLAVGQDRVRAPLDEGCERGGIPVADPGGRHRRL